MVAVFREVWRVLRDDGTLWLNLGSTYAANRSYQIDGTKQVNGSQPGAGSTVPQGYKAKDLVPIPWLVALALQADGWYLRSDIIWSKPNPMPESVTDRPTCAHEYVFLLAKQPKYYYDAEAVKEPSTMHPADWNADGTQKRQSFARGHGNAKNTDAGKEPFRAIAPTRNLRSVWTIATAPCPAAHFAVMPEALVVPCVKAGTSERGCCPECGKPWERVVEKTDKGFADRTFRSPHRTETPGMTNGQGATTLAHTIETRTVGWHPGCKCDAGEPQPCVVLDPFLGAGTVGLVAAKLGREWIGVELNPEYAALAQDRIDHGGDWREVAQAKAGQGRLLDA